MTNTYWEISDGNGNQLTTGLSVHTAREVAQRKADERGESVWLYECPTGDDGDDGEEIRPGVVEAFLDGPSGPFVDYGGHDEDTVIAAIPEGWRPDFSHATKIAGHGRLTYRAPLVRDAS